MRISHLLPATILTALIASPAIADTQIAIGGNLGTTGAGAEVQIGLSDWFGVRGGYNYFTYGMNETYDGVDYDGDLDMSTFGAFVDLRPFSNSFIVTGGAYLGEKKLKAQAVSDQSIEIGGQTFTPSEIGVLDMVADLGDTAPFIGMGFDTTFQGDGPWGFKVILGAMFTDSADVTLTSRDGAYSSDPIVLDALAEEEIALEQDIEDFKVWPVLQAGVTFRF